jgi:putative SOS response-associated peptidase YedK
MCGRYVSVQADSDLLAEFDAIYAGGEATAATGYNVAPTENVRAVVNRPLRGADGKTGGDPVRQVRVMSWGLVPSWAKDRKSAGKLINARSESVARNASFRRAYAARRCLIPADGWYEWRRSPPRGTDKAGRPARQAYFMTPVDGHGLAFAGLYEFWTPPQDPDAPTLTTCSILTTEAVGALGDIHNRMPLVLPATAWARWLDPSIKDPSDLLRAWDEADGEQLELRPVSDRVNAVMVDRRKNDDPAMIERVPLAPESQPLF